MRIALLAVLALVAACASSPQELANMSTAEVCYLGLTQRDKGPMAGAEVQRRNEDCINHIDQLAQMADEDERARLGIKPPLYTGPPSRAR